MDIDKCKIFVGGLNYNTSEDELRSKFEKFGEIRSLRIVTDFDSGRSKGYGFITFSTSQAASKAISEMHNSILNQRRIGVREINKRR